MTQRIKNLCLTLIAMFAAVPAFAQNGVLQGVITDQQGSVIPDVKITATDDAKGLLIRETTSGADGEFELAPLPPGVYTLKAETKGFKTAERHALTLDFSQKMNLGKLVMEVGTITEAVTVDAAVPLVETSTSQKSFVITDRQVNELSLNGRDFQSLMKTLPGVVSNDQSDFRLAFNSTNNWNTNGLRGSMNNASLDGAINTDVGANDGQYTQVSLDSVSEFKLQTSTFNAEFGRNAGVMINAVTKSGSKQFHGTAYDFARNDALDANAFFRNLQGQGKAKLRFNQFGGNIGGPAYIPKISTRAKTKLFFFFNFEGTRATRPSGAAFVDLPGAEMLNGDFSKVLRTSRIGTTQFPTGTVFAPGSITRDAAGNITGGDAYPGNIVPKSVWSRQAPAFLKLLNAVNRSTGVPTPNVAENVRVPLNDSYLFYKNAKVARLDYNLSAKTNVFVRWADDAQNESMGLGIFSSTSYPVFPEFRKKPGASWSANVVSVVSSNMTNEFIFAYNHLTQVVDVVPGTDPATYDRDKLGFTFKELYTGVNLDNKFPAFSGCATNGGSCAFSSYDAGWFSEGKTFAVTDNFTIRHKRHTFKFGGFFNKNINGQEPNWTDAPNFNFGTGVNNPNDTNIGMANLLTGNYLSVAQTTARYYGNFAFLGVEGFGQDSWRIGKRLTIEFGARWAYQGPTYTYGPFLGHYFDLSKWNPANAVKIDIANGPKKGQILPGSGDPFNGMVQEGDAGVPKGFARHRYDNIAPRFGFAWDVFGNGKTALRGGGGLFFERIQQNVYNFSGLGNPPLNYTPTLYGGNIDSLDPSLVAGGTRFPVGVVAFDPYGKVPTIYSWSFGIQQQFGSKVSLDAAYVGNMGRHLIYGRNLNQLPLGTTTAPGNTVLSSAGNLNNAVVPYKGYSSLTYSDFGATSNYNSLQVRATRRFAKGFTANVNYTWSRAMDQVDSDGTSIGYFLDRQRESGVAGFDRTHVINIDYVYELPKFGTKLGHNVVGRALLNGWEFSGITKFMSGTPFGVTAGGNAGTLGGGVRADYVTGNVYPAQRDRLHYFDPLVFARPLDGTLGNLGKNILRGPGVNQWDASLFKNTQFNERVRMQFRLETFNVFNHTQFYGVVSNMNPTNPGDRVTAATAGTAGQETSSRDPRNVQLSVKLYF